MNQKFRSDLGVSAKDDELLLAAINQLPIKLRHVIVMYYALLGSQERTTKEVADLVRNQKTDKPVSSDYILQLRDKGLRSIRHWLEYNKAEKHDSGIPVSTEFWNISVRCRIALDRLKINTVEQVLSSDLRGLNLRNRKELVSFLSGYGLKI